ncbi:hypothetical protein [Leptospira stimsonii]|uniref:Lipoprotein n=1 Tax=Leptospira stimsonii TaxID=2202203 RepID=A0ABY2N0W3_9LEPT|nr:hypothetical protein [Leptospira stimsonii]TGK10119.1 hypothetical protein EHO98_23140 [Leptospira stimsonii]TGM13558.1 hypothetical protein EHQ90_13790 [Leptospira stimsonii]
MILKKFIKELSKFLFFPILLLSFGCNGYEFMVSSEESKLFQYSGKYKNKEFGRIYPGFPLPVRKEKLPDGTTINRLFGDLYGEQVFTYANNLRKEEPEMSYYFLRYDKIEIGEKDGILEIGSPRLKLITFGGKKALIYADKAFSRRTNPKYIGKKYGQIPREEREYPSDRYWVCDYAQNDKELIFQSCLTGEKRTENSKNHKTSIHYLFVPILEDMSEDKNFDMHCNRSDNFDQIICEVEGYKMYGLALPKDYWLERWP